MEEVIENIRYELANIGTNAFPRWVVWKCFEDAMGYELEHLSEVIFSSPSEQKALEVYNAVRGAK